MQRASVMIVLFSVAFRQNIILAAWTVTSQRRTVHCCARLWCSTDRPARVVSQDSCTPSLRLRLLGTDPSCARNCAPSELLLAQGEPVRAVAGCSEGLVGQFQFFGAAVLLSRCEWVESVQPCDKCWSKDCFQFHARAASYWRCLCAGFRMFQLYTDQAQLLKLLHFAIQA